MITRWKAGFSSMMLAVAAMLAAPAAATETQSAQDQRILVMLRLATDHYRPGEGYGGSYGDNLAKSARRHIAGRIAHDHGLTLVSDWPMPLIGLDCFVMVAPAGRSTMQAAADVAHDPGVAWSEPVHLYTTQGAPAGRGDPLFAAQPAALAWRLADLHRIATGRGMTVAIIDSKIEARHPDLAGQLSVAADFVPDHPALSERHGTAVAGIIAARADNGIGIAGIAPDARLIGLRACWEQPDANGVATATVCDSLSLAKALHFAIQHDATVINMSLTGPPDILLSRLIALGLARGATVVAAFDRARADGGFPASEPGVVAVADETAAGEPAGVYAAPGHDIPTTAPGGRWSLVTGSSFAAAHVSGLVALMRQGHRSGDGILRLVSAQTDGGAIDACASLRRASPPAFCGESSGHEVAAVVRR